MAQVLLSPIEDARTPARFLQPTSRIALVGAPDQNSIVRVPKAFGKDHPIWVGIPIAWYRAPKGSYSRGRSRHLLETETPFSEPL